MFKNVHSNQSYMNERFVNFLIPTFTNKDALRNPQKSLIASSIVHYFCLDHTLSIQVVVTVFIYENFSTSHTQNWSKIDKKREFSAQIYVCNR